jgi:hypothetical protein
MSTSSGLVAIGNYKPRELKSTHSQLGSGLAGVVRLVQAGVGIMAL